MLFAIDMPLSDFAFPKAMEVAVSIDFHCLIALGDEEIGFRFFAWLEEAEASALLGEEIDPFDIMVLEHRMDDRSHFDVDEVAFFFGDRDMLFHRGLNRVGDDFLHRFPTARWAAADLVDFGDDGTAKHALIELDHMFSLALEIAQKTQMPIFLS